VANVEARLDLASLTFNAAAAVAFLAVVASADFSSLVNPFSIFAASAFYAFVSTTGAALTGHVAA